MPPALDRDVLSVIGSFLPSDGPDGRHRLWHVWREASHLRPKAMQKTAEKLAREFFGPGPPYDTANFDKYHYPPPIEAARLEAQTCLAANLHGAETIHALRHLLDLYKRCWATFLYDNDEIAIFCWEEARKEKERKSIRFMQKQWVWDPYPRMDVFR
jgi:hypothetical protein